MTGVNTVKVIRIVFTNSIENKLIDFGMFDVTKEMASKIVFL